MDERRGRRDPGLLVAPHRRLREIGLRRLDLGARRLDLRLSPETLQPDGHLTSTDILHTVAGAIIFALRGLNPLEALYVYRSRTRILVSNSLAFLVASGQIALDPAAGIYRKVHTILQGVKAYERSIYRKGENRGSR